MATKLELIAMKKAELAALEAAAAVEIEANKGVVMHEVLDHLQENNITLQELGQFARVVGSKYTDGKGNTWSGKGKKPEWVTKALAVPGAKIEDFLTKKDVGNEPAADTATGQQLKAA